MKTEVTKAESIGLPNNIHNEHNAESINSFNKFNVDSLKFCIPNGVIPLHSYTNEKNPVSSSVLSSIPEAGTPLHNISGGRHMQDVQYLKNSTGFYIYICPWHIKDTKFINVQIQLSHVMGLLMVILKYLSLCVYLGYPNNQHYSNSLASECSYYGSPTDGSVS